MLVYFHFVLDISVRFRIHFVACHETNCCVVSYLSVVLFLQRFWTGSSISKNRHMVEHLQSYGAIRSKRVAEFMELIDRALFVPKGAPPYVDSPVQIGHNATISAPHMHAMCLELLENHLKLGMHVLDVGSGSMFYIGCAV